MQEIEYGFASYNSSPRARPRLPTSDTAASFLLADAALNAAPPPPKPKPFKKRSAKRSAGPLPGAKRHKPSSSNKRRSSAEVSAGSQGEEAYNLEERRAAVYGAIGNASPWEESEVTAYHPDLQRMAALALPPLRSTPMLTHSDSNTSTATMTSTTSFAYPIVPLARKLSTSASKVDVFSSASDDDDVEDEEVLLPPIAPSSIAPSPLLMASATAPSQQHPWSLTSLARDAGDIAMNVVAARKDPWTYIPNENLTPSGTPLATALERLRTIELKVLGEQYDEVATLSTRINNLWGLLQLLQSERPVGFIDQIEVLYEECEKAGLLGPGDNGAMKVDAEEEVVVDTTEQGNVAEG